MEIPKPFYAEEYPGQFRLRMLKFLHKLLAERSKQEGISMKMFMIFSLCLRQYRIIQVCGLRSKIFRQVVKINRGKAVALPRFFGQADGTRKGKPCALNCAVLP